MIRGKAEFAPWIEDPDPPDYWDENDWEDFRRRMGAYFDGRPIEDATWREELHPRGQPTNKGQFGPGGGGGASTKPRVVANVFARAKARAQQAAVTQAEAAKAETGKKGKGAKSKADFDKAKIDLRVVRSEEAQFIKTWNEKIGMDPEEFKKEFLGGVPATMEISSYGEGQINVEGTLQLREGGPTVGRYERNLNIEEHSAYSAFFKIHDEYTDTDIGKKVLAGNIAVYEKVGITSVGVTANIDVGGYAWARYGYVPTQESWNSLRTRLQRELQGGAASAAGIPARQDENKVEAEEWAMLSDDQQEAVRQAWLRNTHDDFLQSEIDNWRETGQALEDAKKQLNYEYDSSNQIPRWADDELRELRDNRKEKGQPEIPFTNQQLFEALSMSEYESSGGDGEDDPEFTWDDDKLQEPKDLPPSEQMQLPGVKPPDYSKRLDDDMREEITDRLVYAFNSKADSDANFLDTPEYLTDNVTEYQEQVWDGMEDRTRYDYARDYDMHYIDAPKDEEDKQKQKEMHMEKKKPEEKPAEAKPAETEKTRRTLLEIALDAKPKAIWEFSDTPGGKDILLKVTQYHSWRGKLNLKDKESYDRFKKYVGRKKPEKKRAA